MEKNYCNKCGGCCKKIAVDFERGIIYRDGIEPLGEKFKEMLEKTETKDGITFCTCKFLKDNLCTNPEKPDECADYPSSPFAFLPENCGYEGLIFLKKEHIKQKIRKLKEETADYTAQLSSDKQSERIIAHHNTLIEKYKMYGSDSW